jgi:hypothetical protein
MDTTSPSPDMETLLGRLEKAGWHHGFHHEACLANGTNLPAAILTASPEDFNAFLPGIPDSALLWGQPQSLFARVCQIHARHPDILPALLDRIPLSTWLARKDAHGALMVLFLGTGHGGAPVSPLLVEKGLDPNEVFEGGDTLLLTAATFSLEEARLLMALGANAAMKGQNGETVLMRLAHYHAPKDRAEANLWVARLVAAGVDIDAVDQDGMPALLRALPYPLWMEALIEQGARIEGEVQWESGPQRWLDVAREIEGEALSVLERAILDRALNGALLDSVRPPASRL